MTPPAACPGIGNPCPINLHKCWRRVAIPWHYGFTSCARNVSADGIGLCDEHLQELLDAQRPQRDTGPS